MNPSPLIPLPKFRRGVEGGSTTLREYGSFLGELR